MVGRAVGREGGVRPVPEIASNEPSLRLEGENEL